MTATQPLLGGKAGSLQAAAGGGSGSGSAAAPAPAPAPAPAAAAPGVGAYDNHRTLTLWPLVALIFFEVSGGPYGVEDAVGAGGPRYALLGFLFFPFIWSVPEALVCAELAGRFPENAGYVAWVSEAFGPFWGFVEGWCSWWSGAIDNGIYPGLLLAYIQQIFPDFLATKPLQLAALAALNVLLTCLNWRGLVVVGGAAMVLVVISVSPFLAMTALAVPHLQLSRLAQARAQPAWGRLLNTLMWNLNYWDSASTLAAEVREPARTFPRAMAAAVPLVVLTYTVPIVVGCAFVHETGSSSGSDDGGGWGEWEDGFFSAVAQRIGGRWLAIWLLCAAALAQVGQYLAEMSADSFQLDGMATRQQLPAIFARRSRYGTPTAGVAASFVVCIVMSLLELQLIIEATNFL